MDMNKFGIPIEPVGYIPEEFKEMKRRKNAFILEVMDKGKVMYIRNLSSNIDRVAVLSWR